MKIEKSITLPDGVTVTVRVESDSVEDFPILRESTLAATARALITFAEIVKPTTEACVEQVNRPTDGKTPVGVGGHCQKCGKLKFGPWTTICTAMVQDLCYMEMYCYCGEITERRP